MLLQPVILSGGSGTRLWPLSREAYPKQFLSLASECSLFQSTLLRIEGVEREHPDLNIEVADSLVVCNETHRFLVAEQFRLLDSKPASILLEPTGRNTAPALTIAAMKAVHDGADPVLLVMPSDHLITEEHEFRGVVARGLSLAAKGVVVTFGIVPTAPETGYGYIHKGKPHAGDIDAFALQAFVEKPDQSSAQGYLDSGDYLWNSGIFVMRASVWLKLVHLYQPAIADACQKSIDGAEQDGDFCRVEANSFQDCHADSIDYAVMEKLSGDTNRSGVQAVVLPLSAGWSDIGAWSALWKVKEADKAGNVIEGDVCAHNSSGNLLIAQHRLLAVVGVDNLVVVETPDAVLVADKAQAQDVKLIAEQLKQEQRSECRFHRRVHRPWGNYEPIDEGDRYQVKRLTVKPGAILSLQMHHHRAEHWVVVKGTAKVTRDDEVMMLSENESVYIPLGATHRLENPGTIPLEVIEVQSGSYLGEDDIVRFEDDYNRTTSD
ncbi:Mannose-1-phosphate guanylyltransferase / Mannose-6-phosphate isomerase [hydrothermal vent metagenome]|uniref:mannose-1-phosphate guanylyltransferase n=1 Tax=hydrothermal vent metagenome TaxID=652676 RepID=A0A3B1BN46_9ZZZZ